MLIQSTNEDTTPKPLFNFRSRELREAHEDTQWSSFYGPPGFSLYQPRCPYCKLDCQCVTHSWGWEFAYCGRCGWWSYQDFDSNDSPFSSRIHNWARTQAAVLEDFSVQGIETPLRELALYLNAHGERLRQVHHTKFEELVAAVWSDVTGSKVEYISYGRHDHGIDIICLRTDNNELVGLQCKRYARPVELGSIHQLFGALVDNSLRHGVFVTSGRFQSGCFETRDSLQSKSNVSIDLVDGRRFLEFLGIYNAEHLPAEHLLSSVELRRLASSFGVPEPAV